ncbi:CIC11C00000001780 [Sungouiella intermedia]|uniref:CIC11C00000001780 n=1 Tax=Sungouiella intermedia TaxID=45354 RepID=A0A1L0D4D7_9ASCO|nr:CIC11C00000001780 [[Candida] intermedia]
MANSSETLRFDVYSQTKSYQNDAYNFLGTVTNRLNVLSDPKQIKEHMKNTSHTAAIHISTKPALHTALPAAATPERLARISLSPQKSSLHSALNPYGVVLSDSKQDIAAKFLALVALGPITKPDVESKLNLRHLVPASEMADLFSSHTQQYLQNDTFTEDDVYPLLALGTCVVDPDVTYIIVKDKAYKDMRPWNFSAYTDFERSLIIDNANNALSRLGYLETHPLRRRIVEKSAPSAPLSHKKTSSLGGGILISGRRPNSANSVNNSAQTLNASPSPLLVPSSLKNASLESPKLGPSRRADSKKSDPSPLKEPTKRKYVALLSLSGSSSEDEKQSKRAKKEGKRSDSSGSHNSINSTGTSYTLPSSVNDETHAEEDHSEEDVKLLVIHKTVSSLPSRPQSSASNAEKKQQYYNQLAAKFKGKYQEYENLHKVLSKDHRRGNTAEKKKQLLKLFEMHTTLAEWKRKLWDYHNENNMTEGIMNLSRHRKQNSGSNLKVPVSAPGSSQVLSNDRFYRFNTASPSVQTADRFQATALGRRQPAAETRTFLKHKVALDY